MTQQGGVSLVLLHCVFNGHESVTHFVHTHDPALYQSLPNTYAVCVADDSGKYRKVVAGLVVRTSLTHHVPEFGDALEAFLETTTELRQFTGAHIRLLPARLGIPDEKPLTELEMLSLLMKQALKHSTAGSA